MGSAETSASDKSSSSSSVRRERKVKIDLGGKTTDLILLLRHFCLRNFLHRRHRLLGRFRCTRPSNLFCYRPNRTERILHLRETFAFSTSSYSSSSSSSSKQRRMKFVIAVVNDLLYLHQMLRCRCPLRLHLLRHYLSPLEKKEEISGREEQLLFTNHRLCRRCPNISIAARC